MKIRRLEQIRNSKKKYRERDRVYNKNKYRRNKEWAVKYKGGKCIDCNSIYPPCVYDFHHINPEIKEDTPVRVLMRSKENIKKEIDKCVLLCSNCHRLRHYLLERKE